MFTLEFPLAANCATNAHESAKRSSTLQHNFTQLSQQFSSSQAVSDASVRAKNGPGGDANSEPYHGAELDAIDAAGCTHLPPSLCHHSSIELAELEKFWVLGGASTWSLVRRCVSICVAGVDFWTEDAGELC